MFKHAISRFSANPDALVFWSAMFLGTLYLLAGPLIGAT